MTNRTYIGYILGLIFLMGWFGCEKMEFPKMDKEDQSATTKPANDAPESLEQYPVATFAAGCFWGVEYNFRRIPGVLDTQVGFMGGHVDHPTYKQVCYTDTHHAEVVHLWYDPEKVSYAQLVKIFFILHDPTMLNRQGPDVGDQYRSAIFYHNPEQKEIAEKVKAELNASGRFKSPIVTEITKAGTFWKAEEYHQQYIEKNPSRSCHVVDFDKIKKILNEK